MEDYVTKSDALFAEACQLIPGGVNSPVRAFRAVGGGPIFIRRGEGSRIWDADDKSYIDYVGSWGPLILGHAHPEVVRAVTEAAANGTSFGAPTEGEIRLANLIVHTFPSIDLVRLVNSGTEACMSAIRLARGYTGRNHILKFDGCYHGHADSLLVKAGSGAATTGVPDSKGVPSALARLTIVCPYNDIPAFREAMREYGSKVACVIVEPLAGNMGVIPPEEGFLEALREVCTECGSLLIFDEVITGFRISFQGAQGLWDIVPDITCLGKIIGGGLPVGAYGGRREVMKWISPEGEVYQAGTLSGNPLAVAAGLATLTALQREGVYETLEQRGAQLAEGLAQAARSAGLEVAINRMGSLLSLFFAPGPIKNFSHVSQVNRELFKRYFHSMLQRGIFLAPSPFEASFVSLAHSPEDIEQTVQAAHEAFKVIQ